MRWTHLDAASSAIGRHPTELCIRIFTICAGVECISAAVEHVRCQLMFGPFCLEDRIVQVKEDRLESRLT